MTPLEQLRAALRLSPDQLLIDRHGEPVSLIGVEGANAVLCRENQKPFNIPIVLMIVLGFEPQPQILSFPA